MKKRIASAVLAVCLVLALLPTTALAADDTSGAWGDNLNWTYDPSTKTLTITGQGDMKENPLDPDLTQQVQHVVIEQGVTSICKSAFEGWNSWGSLTSVSIPDSVVLIGERAFANSGLTRVSLPNSALTIGASAFQAGELSAIYIPASVQTIQYDAFSADLRDIYYGGTAEQWKTCGGASSMNSYCNPVLHYEAKKLPDISADTGERLQQLIYEGKAAGAGLTDIQLTSTIDLGAKSLTIPAGCEVRIDLNNQRITSSASPAIIVEGSLTVIDRTADSDPIPENNHNVTYASGIIQSSTHTINVQNGGEFVLKSGTIQSGKNAIRVVGEASNPAPDTTTSVLIEGGYVESQESAVVVFGGGSEATIRNGVLLSRDNAVIAGNGLPQYAGTSIYMHGGTLISESITSDYIPCGIYHPQQGTLSITKGTIYAEGGVGVLMRGGQLKITNSGNSSDPAPEIITGGNGSDGWVGDSKEKVPAGRPIVLDQKSNYYDYQNIEHQKLTFVLSSDWKDKIVPSIFSSTDYALKTIDDSAEPANTISYYLWKTGAYRIRFDANGGSSPTPDKITVENKLTALPDGPTRTGYTFDGWYDAAEGGNKITTDTEFKADAIVYAHWIQDSGTTDPDDPKTYTITLDPNGGTLPKGQSATLTTGSNGKLTALPQAPVRENYTFKNWTTLNGTAVTTETEFTGDTTIYAKWEKADGSPDDQTYTISFDLNYTGATGAPKAMTTGNNGKLTSSLPVPERAGYTFDGWYTAAANGEKVDNDNVYSASATLYAHWTQDSGTTDPDDPKTYTITFNANGGEGDPVEASTGSDGTVAVWPKNPTRTGYTFDGWYTAASGGTAVPSSTVFTEDTTVYAHWTEESSTPSATRYPIYWSGSVSGGRVYVSHSYAAQGTRVTIEVSPRSNYELDYLSVTNLDTGRSVRLTEYDWDEYTFVMPDSAVDIEVSFDSIDSLDRYGRGSYFILAEPQIPTGPNAWYYRDRHIYHINDGLVPDGTPVTRDMFLSVLYNLTGNRITDSTAVGSETNDAQAWATSHNIVPDIYASGLWGPDKSLSREQAAMLIFGYASYRNYSTSQGSNLTRYIDYSQIRPIARTAMSWAVATNLLPSTTAVTLSPLEILTCGQAGNLIFQFQTNVARNFPYD